MYPSEREGEAKVVEANNGTQGGKSGKVKEVAAATKTPELETPK